jgi:hypothetical protein
MWSYGAMPLYLKDGHGAMQMGCLRCAICGLHAVQLTAVVIRLPHPQWRAGLEASSIRASWRSLN